VFSARDINAPDWSNQTFRFAQDEWRRVRGNSIVGDGPSFEEGTEPSIEWKKIIDGNLIAYVAYNPAGYRDSASTVVRWEESKEKFRWIERPQELRYPDYDEEIEIFFRNMGPIFAKGEQLWRYHVPSDSWDTIGGPFQEDGRPPIFVEVSEGSVYILTVDGRIYVTRASQR
jgi:hypothetical protein